MRRPYALLSPYYTALSDNAKVPALQLAYAVLAQASGYKAGADLGGPTGKMIQLAELLVGEGLDEALSRLERVPPSQRVPEPGPCTPRAHCYLSGSARCQCGEAERTDDCQSWRIESRLTGAQIREVLTSRPDTTVRLTLTPGEFEQILDCIRRDAVMGPYHAEAAARALIDRLRAQRAAHEENAGG